MTLSLFMMLSSVEPVAAQMVDVTVNIEEIEALSELSGTFGTDEPDFYVSVFIRHVPMTNAEHVLEYENQDHLEDLNWEFTRTVDISSNEIIPIDIFLYDANWGLGSADKLIDIGLGSATGLHMVLNPTDCTISVTPDTLLTAGSRCNGNIESEGQAGDHAKIKVSLEMEHLDSGKGTVTCRHTPIWPNVNQTITINTNYTGVQTPLNHTIWINDYENTLTLFNMTDGSRSGTTLAPSEGGQFRYNCGALVNINSEDTLVESGWITTSVGDVTNDNAIPVRITGNPSNSLDVVFIANGLNYTTNDPSSVFAFNATNTINRFVTTNGWDQYQDVFNFWISKDFGAVRDAGPGVGVAGPDGCGSTPPSNWFEDYTWAELGVITHITNANIRDCSIGSANIITVQMNAGAPTRILAHEMGHGLFGLADEYCNTRNGSSSINCDGGYFQNDPHPNLFATLEACNANPTRGNSTCQEFDPVYTNNAIRDWFSNLVSETWFTSDPPINDLMVDNTQIQPLDAERINYIIDRCKIGGCGP